MWEKNNLPIDEDIILRGYYEEALAYSEMRSIVSSGINVPDAMFCANDERHGDVFRHYRTLELRFLKM